MAIALFKAVTTLGLLFKALAISDIDYNLTHCETADERLAIVKSTFAKEGNKNRFFITEVLL